MEMIKFSINGKVVTEISIEGLFAREIEATKELIAYEKGVNINDIKVSI